MTEFETSVVYKASSRVTRAPQRNLVSRKQNKTKKPKNNNNNKTSRLNKHLFQEDGVTLDMEV